jgi:hypothetical protein
MNCSTLLKYQSLANNKTGVSGGVNTNSSGSRNLTFHVNTTNLKYAPTKSKGFSAGVESLITPEKVQHALLCAYAYRDAYEEAEASGGVIDSSVFDDWRFRYVYAPELKGRDTAFGASKEKIKKYPVTLRITGSNLIDNNLGGCISSLVKNGLVKCMTPHKRKGAIAQTLGASPILFTIGEGCEVA